MDNQNNKELGLIDILQIFGQWIVSFAKKMTDWFLFLTFFGIKRWKVFAVVAAVVAVYSAISFKSQDSQYEATMMIRCNAVNAPEMKPFFDKYTNTLGNSLVPEAYVEKKIGLDKAQRELFNSISTHYCVDKNRDGIADNVDFSGKMDSSDEELDSINLCVKVNFADVTILPAISESIEKYITEVTYLKQMNIARLAQQKNRKAFLLNEIRLLDSMQLKTTLRASGSHVFVDNRKSLIYEDKALIMDDYEDIERILEIHNKPITIIDDFVVSQAALNTFPSIIKKNLFLGFLGAYFILFVIFIYNRVKDQYLK